MIRAYSPSDWPALWPILREAFSTGDTYPYPPGIGEADARRAWTEAPDVTFVAEEGGRILGTYYLKTNQPGLGSHVCNCGYIVGKAARRRGLGRKMCAHSLDEARRRGFRAMQFNLVVSTNEGAVALWKDMGFEVVGKVPGGFNHRDHGYVDALIMFRDL